MVINGWTYRRTDRWADAPSYRVTWMREKRRNRGLLKRINKQYHIVMSKSLLASFRRWEIRQAIPAQNGRGLPVPSFLYVVFDEEAI